MCEEAEKIMIERIDRQAIAFTWDKVRILGFPFSEDFYMKFHRTDGLILGLPVYGADIIAEIKVFLDYLGLADLANPKALRCKPGAAVSAVRRGGSMEAVATMNNVIGILSAILKI